MAELRASDADRERVIRALRRHHADGRITTEELEERIGAVWATKHVSALAGVTADLPDLDDAPPADVPAIPLPRAPGRRGFSVQWRTKAPASDALLGVLQHVAPPLSTAGYGLAERADNHVIFVRRRIPGWVWPVAICAFPVGLLAFLARTEDRLTVEVMPQADGSTVVYAGGVAPLGLRRAFALLAG